MTLARRLAYRLAVPVGLAIIRGWLRTCRVVRVEGIEHLEAALAKAPSLVPCYWHQHQLLCGQFLLQQRERGLRVGWLISPSVDGELGAMMVRRIGRGLIRGSSTHTGARALRDYYQALIRDALSPVITPDGPRGPRFKFKPGAILLAQMSGRPMLPMSYAATRAWLIKWDKFVIPMPFARVAIAIGPPRYVPRVTDAATLQPCSWRWKASCCALSRWRGPGATDAPAPRGRARAAAGHALRGIRRHGVADRAVAAPARTLRDARRRHLIGRLDTSAAGGTARGRAPVRHSQSQCTLLAQPGPTASRGLAARTGPGSDLVLRSRPGASLLQRAGLLPNTSATRARIPGCPEESFADRYIRLGNETPAAFAHAAPARVTTTVRQAQLDLTASQHLALDAWLASRGLDDRPYIIVHPGSRHLGRRRLRSRAGASKYWPEQHWAQVVRAVRELRPDHALLLTGTSVEVRFVQEILQHAGVRDAHNLAGALRVATLLPLLARAHSMICVDTGPGHAAAALGCPTVALFGSADPALFRPGGATTPTVTLSGTINGQPNILGISVETVVRAWIALAHSPAPSRGDSVKSLR